MIVENELDSPWQRTITRWVRFAGQVPKRQTGIRRRSISVETHGEGADLLKMYYI